jgi:VCBS repeat-containing protein
MNKYDMKLVSYPVLYVAMILVIFFALPLHAIAAPNPVVAIHVSELTQALETTPAQPPTPTGPGTSGNQWWYTSWHYFVAYESLKEALRSDGTPFVVVSDADIAAGKLLQSDGSPRYPIVISLVSEAISDTEIQPILNYVNAGGFLFSGSSAFTRRPDGTSRGDFAIANEMGIHMVNPSLSNWGVTMQFRKVLNHQLVSNVPDGTLTWRLPTFSEEIPWGIAPNYTYNRSHNYWQVSVSGATVLAQEPSGRPLLAIKNYGNGKFIYHSVFQPLLGHGGYDPGMFNYLIFRNAIEWALQSANLPTIKLSPWQYQYDAAFVVRHDFENDASLIRSIENSSQFEQSLGAKGDYYFATGALREQMTDISTVIPSLQRAVSNYGATIGSHNGGLANPNYPGLDPFNYVYYHWGPDEVLDLTPPGYANGKAYAKASISNSFQDIETWLAGFDNGRSGCGSANNCPRTWISPFFNATRENTYDILQQLGAVSAGEQKISPFPHWTLSTQTLGKRYSNVTLPASDWFFLGDILQDVDLHTYPTMTAAVDFYYDLGALINIYGHLASQPGTIMGDYVNYCANKPRIWATNHVGVYDWWRLRSNVTVTPSYSVTGNTAIAQATINGATNSNTAVEIDLQPWARNAGASSLQVFFNGSPANINDYRITQRGIKLKVGALVSTVEVRYPAVANNQPPVATNDTYSTNANTALNQAAPGVLGNDTDPEGAALTAQLVSGPTHGDLTLNANGSIAYTPVSGYVGSDSFTYRANDGASAGSLATVAMTVTSTSGILFSDDFTRPLNVPNPLYPWVNVQGSWGVTNGVLQGASSPGTYASIYTSTTPTWTDYSVEALVQFPEGVAIGKSVQSLGGSNKVRALTLAPLAQLPVDAFGGGIGGRVNPTTGAHYGAWIYPDGSAGGSNVLKLIKFRGWTSWSGTPMQQVSLPSVGTSPHALKMVFAGNRIQVFYDGVLMIDATDNNFDARAAYLSGGVSGDMWTNTSTYAMGLDNVVVRTTATVNQPPVAVNDSYSTSANTALNRVAPGLLSNDTDPEGAVLTAQLVAGPSHGALTLNANGSFAYTPVSGYVGSDSFTYRANDGTSNSNVATVAITVTSVTNQPPVAVNDTYSTSANAALIQAAPGVLGNDTDPEGATLTAQSVAGPSHGTLTLNANGSFTYTPVAGYVGSDSFTYRANDGTSNSNVATVAMTVTSTSGVLLSDDFTRPPNVPSPLSPWVNVQGNWAITNGVLQGSSSPSAYANIYTSTTPLWTDYSVEALVQFPAGAFGGGIGGRVNPTTGARYGAWVYPDGSAGGSNVLKLVKFRDWTNWNGIPIQQVNLPSVGTGSHALKMVFAGNRIQVFYDGALMIDVTDNNYDSRAPYLSGGVSGDMWTSISSYIMGLDNVVVRTSAAINQPPVAANDTYSTSANTALNQIAPGVLGNDTDPEGAALTALLVAGPSHGTLTLNANGSFTYTPVAGYVGSDNFTYRANDGTSNSNVATVAITIVAVDFQSPAANSAVTGNGDGNGFQTNPANAYANDGLFAVDTNSGINTSTSCTNAGKDKHIYYNYGLTLPTGGITNGIEVRLDARVDATSGAPKMCVELSWDGGTTWTAAKITPTLTTSEGTYVLGGVTDTWGHTWTVNDLSNANFRLRIANVASFTSRDFSLDWVAVQVR